MKKKIFIQIMLIFIIFFIIFFIYKTYFYKNTSSKISSNQKSIVKETDANIIKDISYKSFDVEGRSYNISAKSGSMDSSNSQLIKMNNVIANIKLEDGTLIEVTSDFANYNSITYETKFISNVVSKYLDHKIFSEFLIIDFSKNILEATKKMTYKNPKTIMKADKLEVNLLTKDIRISNFDEKVASDIDKNQSVEIEFSNK